MGSAPRDRSILLAGMMGAGKSSVGRALARRLGWEFIDTDEEIEGATGMSIAEIFRVHGEQGFRGLERQALAKLPESRAVVALGGGAPVSAESRALLGEKGRLVWLDADAETLAARVPADDDRPLLVGLDAAGRVERLRALRAERREAYASAEVRVCTDGLEVDDVCRAVARALGREDVA